MHEHIVLVFDAPMMSFGYRFADDQQELSLFPSRSMLAGLVGRAVGIRRNDIARLDDIYRHLRYASRWDREPTPLLDRVLHVNSSADADLCPREYLVDGVMTLVVRSQKKTETPFWASALAQPAAPLYIGNKSCLPSTPIYFGRLEAINELDALIRAPAHERACSEKQLANWPDGIRVDGVRGTKKIITDTVHWNQQLSRQLRREGQIHLEEA